MSRILPIVLLAAVAGVLSAAQLTVDVGLVNVVATVLDDRGRYVADLIPEDFILYEDGEVQFIDHFAQSDDLPVSVGVLLDTSGSMERKIDTATEAVERFLRQIHPDDEIFLITFNDRARLIQDFTDDRGRLANGLRRVRVGGGTALYDALALGVDHIRDGKHDKKAILLISDGEDTASTTSFERAQRYVRESEVMVYALGIAPEQENVVRGRVGATPADVSHRRGHRSEDDHRNSVPRGLTANVSWRRAYRSENDRYDGSPRHTEHGCFRTIRQNKRRPDLAGFGILGQQSTKSDLGSPRRTRRRTQESVQHRILSWTFPRRRSVA